MAEQAGVCALHRGPAPNGYERFTGAEGADVTLKQWKAIVKEGNMPQIIVTADNPRAHGERAVMFTERVSSSDFESDHFQAQLVERLGWAVGDADALEHDGGELTDGAERRELEPAEQHRIEPATAPGVLVRPS